MSEVKERLLKKHCPDIPYSRVHAGYHRGRRIFFGNVYWPDIISVHHLHLHVIVEPRTALKLFKYPPWLPLMWKSEIRVENEIGRLGNKHCGGSIAQDHRTSDG